MTSLQKAQMRESELKTAIREEFDKPDDERDSEVLDSLTKQLKRAEIEVRAALAVEEQTAQPDIVQTAEQHELVELRSRLDFGEYIQAALSGRGVIAGAELEYNQHIGLPENRFPLEILAGQVETRAARDGDAQANQGDWLDRVFANTASAMLGVSMRSVEPGVATYPVTTAGGTPIQRGRTEDVAESTYTIDVVEMKPSRASVYGEYTIEDNARLPGLADAIQRDMANAMMEAIDRKIFLGDTGANENVADIVGLNTASISEQTLTQANKLKGPETLQAFTNLVDGRYAATLADLNVVASVGSYRLWESTIHNDAADNQTVAAFMRLAGLNWTSRGEIDTDTAADDFGAFVGLARGIEGAAVAAVWNAGELVVDPYSKATSGEVRLIMHYLWNFALPRTANFKRIKFVA